MRNSLPGTPFSERDQARQPTPWKSWGMSGGLNSGTEPSMAKTSWPVQSALYGRISHATPCREAAQSNGAFRTQPFSVPIDIATRLGARALAPPSSGGEGWGEDALAAFRDYRRETSSSPSRGHVERNGLLSLALCIWS